MTFIKLFIAKMQDCCELKYNFYICIEDGVIIYHVMI
jgi:hypothetical protein